MSAIEPAAPREVVACSARLARHPWSRGVGLFFAYSIVFALTVAGVVVYAALQL